jgi:uncharacterized protein
LMAGNANHLWYPRALETTIAEDLTTYPVVAIVGARQVGKSTLAKGLAAARDMAYVTLDDPDLLAEARTAPAHLLAREAAGGICIDEAQRAPALFLSVKQQVDRDGQPGRILLTGSNQPQLGAAVGDSLLGRAAYRTLRPLSQSEIRLSESHDGWSLLFTLDDDTVLRALAERAELNATVDWRDAVNAGGFPRALVAPPGSAGRLLDDYVSIFVRRDVRDILGIESPERFEAFFRLQYARTGQEQNYSSMSRDLGTPVNTLRRWSDALERSYMLERVPAFTRNASERVIKSPKLYAVDSAMAIVAARESEPTGFHLETLIASDLLRWRDAAAGRLVSHWRLGTGQEVDFVVQQGSQLLAVEVKASSTPTSHDARHLRSFREHTNLAARTLLLSCDPEPRRLSDGTIAAPWWAVV